MNHARKQSVVSVICAMQLSSLLTTSLMVVFDVALAHRMWNSEKSRMSRRRRVGDVACFDSDWLA